MQKTYAYSGGNVTSIQYSAQSGTLGTENFVYANGHNTEIKLNGSTTIWKLTAENALGKPIEITTGSMNRSYSYNAYGIPTGRIAGSIQNFTYSFDVQKGNLLTRIDNKHNKTETFSYDNLNRLTSAGGNTITYAVNGNITRIQGVGTMTYGNSAKPYQLTMLSPEGTAIPLRNQSVSYTSFQRPSRVDENGLSASFTYNADGIRVKMYVANGAIPVLTRYYIGGQYELDAESGTERLYLGGDAYSAPAVYVKEAGNWKIYYICRDYLGSITHVANADGSLKQELSYDAWGRLRNPSTQVAYAPGSEPTLFLGRGYTGHEHLPWFGLVNMNARLYDPALGRFLSPDPYVQMPDFTQNFNRYSYCLNNPLMYVDENGEWFFSLFLGPLGAVIDAALWSATIDAAIQVGKMVMGKQDGFNWGN
jgi:RHS repeat-associated protein